MQAYAQEQDQDQETITATRSLSAVKTLITAGFGCMTYLRGLLPDENFEDAFLSSTGTSLDGTPVTSSQKNVSGVRIKTVKRGYSSEGDQMLDYLEKGVFDALEKRYLSSFMFAVYLDKEDPSNVIETWTFNFRYHRVPGTNVTVPVFTLDRAMETMSLAGAQDPIMSASMQGRNITLGEVKRSVKNLIRGVIAGSQGLDMLPHRRFATFKLFYLDSTPEDYEPPFFIPADPTTKKFHFATHHAKEMPEKLNLGTLETPFHSVTLGIASVSAIIPSSEDDFAQFSGLSNTSPSLQHSGLSQDQVTRQRAMEAQMDDAATRRVLWDAESRASCKTDAVDAEGELDPDYYDIIMETPADTPIGMREDDGSVAPILAPPVVKNSKRQDQREVNYASQSTEQMSTSPPHQGENTQVETTPTKEVSKPSSLKSAHTLVTPRSNLARTRSSASSSSLSSLEDSPTARSKSGQKHHSLDFNKSAANKTVPGSNEVLSRVQESHASEISHGIDTQLLQEAMMVDRLQSSEPETLPPAPTRAIQSQLTESLIQDPIESFPEELSDETQPEDIEMAESLPRNGADVSVDPHDQLSHQDYILASRLNSIAIETPRRLTRSVKKGSSPPQSKTHLGKFTQSVGKIAAGAVRDCDCGGAADELEWLFCEKCERWLHTWCMGYNNAEDERMPEQFKCFPCLLADDPNSSLLDNDQIDAVLYRWKELSLFRRALKVTYSDSEKYPETQAALKKRLGIDAAVAGQVWKRLEQEGFVVHEDQHEPVDLFESMGNDTKSKPKSRGGRKSTKRVPARTPEALRAFQQYFEPGGEHEAHALGLDALRRKPRASNKSSNSATSLATKSHHTAVPLPHESGGTNTTSASHQLSSVGVGNAAIDSALSTASSRAPNKRKANLPAHDPLSQNTFKRIKISMAAHPLDLEEY